MAVKKRRTARERGAAAVEFALILPIILMLIGGTIDFGRLFWEQIQLANAARDGARMASMGSSYTTAQVQGRVQIAAAPLAVDTSGVTVSTCSGSAPQSATVTVVPHDTFKWVMLGMFPGITTPSPQGKATMTCL